MILDHSSEDKSTLSVCSVVCRDWLPCSRSHLFHRLHIDRLVADRNQDALESRLEEFYRVLIASPSVCKYIKELYIGGVSSESMVLVDAILELASLLPNLKSLGIAVLTVTLLGTLPLSSPGFGGRKQLGHLRQLKINCRDMDVSALLSLFRAFISIDDLEFRIYLWEEKLGTPPAAEWEDLKIRKLVIWDSDDDTVIFSAYNLYRLIPDGSHLTHLDLSFDLALGEFLDPSISWLGAFIKQKCGQLQYLRLDFEEFNMMSKTPGKRCESIMLQ